MRGTTAAYAALLRSEVKPNDDTLYFISDPASTEATLYLGSKLIAGGESDISVSLDNIVDIKLSDELKDKSFLVYDKTTGLWSDSTLESALSVFIGASQNAAGISGLVPAPELGKTNLYLRSDGTWAEIPRESYVTSIENESNLSHSNIINTATQGILLAPGDIVVIKDVIADNKYQHTAYIYNGSTWVAMDGNYNAENVYFDDDFVFTEAIGTVTIPSSGNKKVTAKGKNLKEFFSTIFAQQADPEVTQPYLTITSSTAKAYEVGTVVTPEFSLTFNPGSYSYGPATDVDTMGYKVTDSLGKTTSSRVGTMPAVTVEDNTSYTISAYANHSAGKVPLDNLGNPCEEKAILTGKTETVTTGAMTGFRYAFAGMDSTGGEIDSDFIRKLTKVGNGTSNHTITWRAADLTGVKRYIVAIPNSSSKKVSKVVITSSMNADATSDYVLQPTTVNVEGNNDYKSVAYKVWIYEPASIASTEIHQITIS